MPNADPQTLEISGVTLLVVDDDPSFRRALRRLLEQERISVVEADDGEQAIRVIEQDEAQVLDAVLTDVSMQAVSGPELIAVLREYRPAIAGRGHVGMGPSPTRPSPGTLPEQAIRARGTDRNARTAGPHARSDPAASTANARGCGRIPGIGQTATGDSKRTPGQDG